jgi:ABC-type antimicrobial peptide transport system permease subunit
VLLDVDGLSVGAGVSVCVRLVEAVVCSLGVGVFAGVGTGVLSGVLVVPFLLSVVVVAVAVVVSVAAAIAADLVVSIAVVAVAVVGVSFRHCSKDGFWYVFARVLVSTVADRMIDPSYGPVGSNVRVSPGEREMFSNVCSPPRV